MKRFFGIVTLVLALVALGAPSVSLGAGMTGPVWTASDSTVSEQESVKPGDCKLLGGKRVLPCHPDLGVMVSQASLVFPSIRQRSWRDVVLPLAAPQPEAELPPPRAA
jgi:hypothetical protein